MTVVDIPQQTMGDLMRKARKAAHLSQTEVATQLGTSQARVSRWENGDDDPGLREYRKFIEITGAEWLLDLRVLPTSWNPDLAGQAA